MVKRSDIIGAARTYKGTPFRHQGRAKGAGVDCIGLIVCAAREAGIGVQDRTDYPLQPIPSELLAGFGSNLDRRGDLAHRPGDVLVFWIVDPETLPPEKRAETPQHVALATDAGLIHSWSGGAKRVVEHGMTQGWASRLHSVWTFRGLED